MPRTIRRFRGRRIKRFATNLTEKARKGEIDPVSGRDEEIRQIIDILMRRRQNNPILTGEAGVGKTAVVEGFALRLARGDVPPPLQNVSLYTLDIGLLQAGASMKGEFENRLRQVIDEVQASPEADHPVRRRGAHADRRGRSGRHRRRREPAQAGAGARHAAHDRRDDLGRIQEVHREGPGADAALPGREGRGAERGQGDPDGPRRRVDAREASPGAGARRSARSGGAAVAPLHPGAAAARQGGQPARHGLRARRHQPARRAAAARGLPADDRGAADRAGDHRPRGNGRHQRGRAPEGGRREARGERAAPRVARGALERRAGAGRSRPGDSREAAAGERAASKARAASWSRRRRRRSRPPTAPRRRDGSPPEADESEAARRAGATSSRSCRRCRASRR